MAFVVEDGTGKPDANSYVDVGFADGYFADRNNEVWESKTEEEKQAKLIEATDYINLRWGSRIRGYVMHTDQALPFPTDAWLGIPMNIKKATCEYALRAFDGPLAPDLQRDPSGYQVSRRINKVGPLERRVDYAFMGPGARLQPFRVFPAVDSLIWPYLRRVGGGTVRNG